MDIKITDIEDVRIIVKLKGKHYSLTPKDNMDDEATHDRIAAFIYCIASECHHDVYATALEDIK